MSTLNAREAASIFDAYSIMHIRNRCRAGFSTHTDEIAPAEQERWWEATAGRRLAWLYRPDDSRSYVGFGLLLRQDDGLWTTTVAVLPEHAGKGYGRAITHDIVMRCPGQCRATARRDNPAAVKLHVADDWDIVDGPDPRLAYFRSKAQVTA